MPGSLGGASFDLLADNTQLVAAFVQAQAKAQQASAAIQAAVKAQTDAIKSGSAAAAQAAAQQAQAAQTAIQAAQQASARFRDMGGAAQQAGGGLTDLARSALALGAGVAGVSVSIETLHAALAKVAEQTQKTAQIQFQLGRTYGESAGQMTKFANDLAAATGKSNASVQEGIARFAVLENGYGLTRAQTEKLAKATLDLAAVTGTDTVEAFERVIGVFRDGGESAEKLGLVLNDQSVKAFANLTAEQRKNFEQMDALTKSQIRYAEAMKQAADFQGAATDRANQQVGAWDRLTAATDNLAGAVGRAATTGTPGSNDGGLVGRLAEAVDWMGRVIDRATGAQQALDGLAGAAGRVQIGPDPGMPGSTTGGLSDAAARQAIVAARQRREQEVKGQLQDADRLNDATVKSAIDAIDRERKAKEVWYGEEKQRIEARRTYQLEDIETRKAAALQAIKDEQQATKDADDQAIQAAQRRKQVELDAADAARDQATAAIKAQQQQNERDRTAQDRQAADDRLREDQQLADAREKYDREHADFLKEDDREREAAHQRQMQRIEDEHTRAVRGFESEADEDRKKSDARLRNLDRLAQKEDDRHREALDHIESEKQRQLDEIDATLKAQTDAIDAQIKGIDDVRKAREDASKTRDLQGKVAEAQAAVTAATGTGTPEQIEQARQELITAHRLGD
jgi:hypothetical protein